ncbi:MAG: hypothetical protein PHN55_13280 [Dysgonamonadaceae bacterium]|nr:hypothetical protein [Dysgonamonadaceae bacterium]
MKIEDYYSELDSKRFGINIAKVNDFNFQNYSSILKELKLKGIKLILTRVNSEKIQLINALEENGFRVKDTQLTLNRKIENYEIIKYQLKDSNNITISEVKECEIEILGDIAYNAFQGYGHYNMNKLLDSEESNMIYKDWTIRSCRDKNVADFVFVAKVNDDVAGFLTLKNINSQYGVQYLGCVVEKYRNFGVFRMLINECMIKGIELNNNWQQTFLLSINYPVISSYLKLGFKISESNHTMHCWL